MVTQRLTEQQAIPPKEKPPAARPIVERFQAAALLLRTHRAKFTPEQEARFHEKWMSLCDLYEAEYPGKQAPNLRFDALGLLEPVWPRGFLNLCSSPSRAPWPPSGDVGEKAFS